MPGPKSIVPPAQLPKRKLSARRAEQVYEAVHLERRHGGYADYTTQPYAVWHGSPADGIGPSSKPCLQGCFFKESLFNTRPDHSLETFSPPYMHLEGQSADVDYCGEREQSTAAALPLWGPFHCRIRYINTHHMF